MLVALLVLAVQVRCYETSYYSIDSTQVYSYSNGYPAACSCMEDGVTDANCDVFQCTCACDIQAGVCDYNCCCDPDCSSAQQSRFADTSAGCDAEGYVDTTTPLCYNSLELYAVNPRTPLSGEPTSRQAVGDALCIEKYNFATAGDYYTDVDTQSSDIFTSTYATKDYNYGDDSYTSTTLDAYYDQGDNIAAFKGQSSAELFSTSTGYFSLPAADYAGQCNDYNFVTFENNVDERSCSRQLEYADADLFAKQCESSFAVDQYVQALYVGATADVDAASNTGTNYASNVVQVTIGSIFYEQLNDTMLYNVTTDWMENACHTKAHNSAASWIATTDNACRFAIEGRDPYTPNLPVCQNMVKSVAYTVTHDGDAAGTITKVVADVVIADVQRETHHFSTTEQPYTAAFNQTVGSMITQKFSVTFKGAYTGTASSSNANLVERARSGNPGYLMGKPVLFGASTTDSSSNTYIAQTVEGVQVPSPITKFDPADSASFGKGKCPELYGKTSLESIAFGYDMSSSCTLELTRQQLEGLCCRGSTYCSSTYSDVAPLYTDSTGEPYFFSNVSAGYVGIWGNSDPLVTSQWTEVNVRTSSAVRDWDKYTGICTGMASGIAYKFLVAKQGETQFPQNKIVAAEVEYITSDWYSNVPYNDTMTTQSFPVTVTAEFVWVDEQATEGYAPPAPPVLFKVPYDVFYPFFASPAAPAHSVSAIVTVALCTMAVTLNLLW